MTIDEAINDFKKMAENARGDIIDGSNLEPQEKHYNSQLELYVKEKEQIADWLEELKELRATSCGYSKEDIELNRNAMYNKAIDDAKSVVLQTLDNRMLVDTLHLRLEKLKVGGKNE